MEELIKILSLSDYDVEQYVDNKITNLDSISSDINEVALEDGEIYKGWINTNASYLPSGNRSKGFKLTKQFYIEQDVLKNLVVLMGLQILWKLTVL